MNNIHGFENIDLNALLSNIISPESEEVSSSSDESVNPSVSAALNSPEYISNFRGLLTNFIAREDDYFKLGMTKISNEVNYIVECIGLEALHKSSLESSNLENKAYIYAGRVIWKSYFLANINREKKIHIASLINRALEHAYYNTYYV